MIDKRFRCNRTSLARVSDADLAAEAAKPEEDRDPDKCSVWIVKRPPRYLDILEVKPGMNLVSGQRCEQFDTYEAALKRALEIDPKYVEPTE